MCYDTKSELVGPPNDGKRQRQPLGLISEQILTAGCHSESWPLMLMSWLLSEVALLVRKAFSGV